MANKFLRITYFILLAITPIFSQDDYNQWLKEQDASFSGVNREETVALAAISKEFDNYAVEQDKLFQSFKDEVEKKWDSFRFSGKKVYVNYDDDLDARGSIDFEKGEVEIEVIVEQKDGDSRIDIEKVAKKKLQKKIETLVVKPAEDKKAILKDQVADKNGKKITEKNAKSFSKEVVRSKKPVKNRLNPRTIRKESNIL